MSAEYIAERLEKGLHLIPSHMHGGVRRYFLHGIEGGSFLNALLSNDLMGTLRNADDDNLTAIPQWGRFLYNHVPEVSYGSPERVTAWLKSFADQVAA